MSNRGRNRLGSGHGSGNVSGIIEENKEESKEVKIGRIDTTGMSRSGQLAHSQTVNFVKQQLESSESKKLLGLNHNTAPVRQHSQRSSMIE